LGAQTLLEPLGLLVAALVGLWVRLPPILAADYPLNDGALFSIMIEAVRAAHYALPWTISYNATEIPFAYPPLAFYLAALTADIAGSSAIDVLRFLPLVFNIASVIAFYLMARAVLASRLASVIALIVFVALPGSYLWLIGGGGLSRSLGLCFALLALREAFLLYTAPDRLSIARMATFAALTAVSHLEMAWLFAVSAGAFLLCFGRNWASFRATVIAATVAALLALPWWYTVIARFGLAPLQAASGTGSLLRVAMYITDAGDVLVFALLLVLTGLCAGLVAIRDPRWFALGWIGLLFFLNSRSYRWMALIPLALALGEFVASAALRFAPRLFPQHGPEKPWAVRAHTPVDRILSAFAAILLVGLSVWLSVRLLELDPEVMHALSPDERAAMGWVAANMSTEAHYLILGGDVWASDRTGEWFPLLAQRLSVVTPQGQEWIAGGEFERRLLAHGQLQGCAWKGLECIEEWSQKTGFAFDVLYLPKRNAGNCCTSIRSVLHANHGYELVYDAAGATIVARRRP